MSGLDKLSSAMDDHRNPSPSQRVDAQAADEDVDAVVADDDVVELVAGQVDRGRRGGGVGIQHLDLGPVREAVAHAGLHLVEAFAGIFQHQVVGIIDDEDVEALATQHRVGAGAAVDDVGTVVAREVSAPPPPFNRLS